MSIQTPKKHYVPLKVQDSVGQPGRVGGGGEEEEGPGGDDDQHGGDVVQEDVPLPPVSHEHRHMYQHQHNKMNLLHM